MASLISAEPGVIRVLVADTTPLNSQMLAEVLARHRQFLVFESGPGRHQVLAALAQHHPDVAIVSGNSGEERDGVSLTETIRGVSPAIRVLQLLDQSDRQSVVQAFRTGARGIFCRTSSLDLLAKCITRLQQGHVWANAEELNFVMDAFSAAGQGHKFAGTGNVKLSRRELDVTRCVAEGLTNREIAARLGLTEHTVKNYLFRIFDKVGVSSRVELVLFALSAPASPDPPAPADTQKPPRRSELALANPRAPARKQLAR